MPDDITNAEAVQMMLRCKLEIQQLRQTIDTFRPKAEAYDNIAAVLRLLPQPSDYHGEDLVWILERRINQLKGSPADASPGS
jgi:hypothetical protein